jgi:predicted dehydrogenase
VIRDSHESAVHTLLFYDPGHFHAALTLRKDNPRIDRDVHLYAHGGQDRERFLALIQAFNARENEPTRWCVHVHEADDPLEQLIAERRGDVVVLAGRNAGKLASIARLHQAGFHVLADKPWLTSSEALPFLDEATAGPPLAMDIMTERHEVLARLRRRIVSSPELFGALVGDDDGPAIEIASLHHLYKMVNGRPLERPWWYYDIDTQGDGLVDIQSHLVDQVQWMVMGDDAGDFDDDVTLLGARRWPTQVPLDLYRQSTGEDGFPDALADYVGDGVLELHCNGEIDYRLRGVRVRQRAEWGQREPPGSGDRHPCTVRGTRSTVIVRHGLETGYVAELDLEPGPGIHIESALRTAVADWQSDFPGLAYESSGDAFRLTIPDALRTSHESHFAMVLETFLDYLDAGRWPHWLTGGIRMRYQLLAHARELALR